MVLYLYETMTEAVGDSDGTLTTRVSVMVSPWALPNARWFALHLWIQICLGVPSL